jgi:hypothetical protein
MVKCPLCQFENEDGSLFCDQCKADLGAASQPAPVISEPEPEVALAHAVAIATAEPIETAPAIAVADAPVIAAGQSAHAEAPVEAPGEVMPPAAGGTLAPGVSPKLIVLRGLKINAEYPIYEGQNFIGRTDDKPVDIDLEDQEPPDRIWSSRQHACINLENGRLEIEDLNSSNGTFVNRTRVYPGQKRLLNVNDVIQIGTVQMRVKT